MSIKGALFYYISELTYSTLFGIQTFLPAEFPILAREYHDGIYPVSCYYIAKVRKEAGLAYVSIAFRFFRTCRSSHSTASSW